MSLLGVLKDVEQDVGRRKTFRNGPRVVDLDLVVYGDQIIKIGTANDEEGKWLEVPHPRLGEREFVLRPLAE
jgi:dihydroneopterin aldolase/2-amino-4-hydroxy-6-hydroxymethyldihydropteridine diphosphokinase/dihydropteroate synthase